MIYAVWEEDQWGHQELILLTLDVAIAQATVASRQKPGKTYYYDAWEPNVPIQEGPQT